MTDKILQVLDELGEDPQQPGPSLDLPAQIAVRLKLNSDFKVFKQALDAYNVPFLLVKGLATSALLGQEHRKIPGDWDLIIPHEHSAQRAAQLALESLGFRQFYPQFDSTIQWKAWEKFGKAQVYKKDVHLDIDLHWRLFSQWIGLNIPFENLWKRRQTFDIGQGHLADTLSNEDTLLFLCLHCAQDGWNSLKSLWEIHLALQTLPINSQKLREIADIKWPLLELTADLASWIFDNGQHKLGENFSSRSLALRFLQARRNSQNDPGPSLLHPRYWQDKLRWLPGAFTGLLTPSVEDIRSTRLPALWLYPLWRCMRLGNKFVQRRLLLFEKT